MEAPLRKHARRGRTEATTKISLRVLRAGAVECADVDMSGRPKTRADCLPGGSNEARPCPWVGCRYNTFLDVRPNGNIVFNFGTENVDEVPPELSCALDIADDESNGATLERIGDVLQITRERVRQLLETTFEHIHDQWATTDLGDLVRKMSAVVAARNSEGPGARIIPQPMYEAAAPYPVIDDDDAPYPVLQDGEEEDDDAM